MAGVGDLLAKEPLSHSGAQSVFPLDPQDLTSVGRVPCTQKGGVKIQNRGPEQEILAVTCVRLIAQKHRY